MNYQIELETRWMEPITIARCMVVLPMPPSLFEFLDRHGINVESSVADLVCNGGPVYVGTATPLDRFPELWRTLIASFLPDEAGRTEQTLVPFRVDVFDCVKVAAATVDKSAADVILAILTRNMPMDKELSDIYLKSRKSPRQSIPSSASANVISGPWKPILCEKGER